MDTKTHVPRPLLSRRPTPYPPSFVRNGGGLDHSPQPRYGRCVLSLPVGSSTDNDVVPGFGGGEVPAFGNGGGGFGGGSGSTIVLAGVGSRKVEEA